MDEEFALCWNNFQDNIATGFQNLYDRGDLVDVTLACDGRLLHAHKIVLAICSPYFQEMFTTNPCKHPIIFLKDVSFVVMTELLQFMYQGVVNVKNADLPSFMKIAQALQIKGLATTHGSGGGGKSSAPPSPIGDTSRQSVTPKPLPIPDDNRYSMFGLNRSEMQLLPFNSASHISLTKRLAQLQAADFGPGGGGGGGGGEQSINYPPPRKLMKRSHSGCPGDVDPNNSTNESMDGHIHSADDTFLSPIPHISIVESRFDLSAVKRETTDPTTPNSTAGASRTGGGGGSGSHCFDYSSNSNSGFQKGLEYPNDLSGTDMSKVNHMDIPVGSHITMLSSTSLLHGSCVFNRNNTVATQQGMKTYWLCKSYRITMCRARCITHQGRIISATGVHNHAPHMKGTSPTGSSGVTPGQSTVEFINPPVYPVCSNSSGSGGGSGSGSVTQTNQRSSGQGGNNSATEGNGNGSNPSDIQSNLPAVPTLHPLHQQHQQQQQQQQLHQQHNNLLPQHVPPTDPSNQQSSSLALHNMMQNVLNQNSFMHNLGPIMTGGPVQPTSGIQLAAIATSNGSQSHPPSNLQITALLTNNPTNVSPTHSPRTTASSTPSSAHHHTIAVAHHHMHHHHQQLNSPVDHHSTAHHHSHHPHLQQLHHQTTISPNSQSTPSVPPSSTVPPTRHNDTSPNTDHHHGTIDRPTSVNSSTTTVSGSTSTGTIAGQPATGDGGVAMSPNQQQHHHHHHPGIFKLEHI